MIALTRSAPRTTEAPRHIARRWITQSQLRTEMLIPELGPWLVTRDGDPIVYALASRHYSFHHYRRPRRDKRIVGPGEKLVLVTADNNAIFIWRRFNRPDLAGQIGICCSLFRNEGAYGGAILSSALILAAEELALLKWQDRPLRFFTYINPRRIASPNPGYCFKMAGWRYVGKTRGGLVILEKVLSGHDCPIPTAGPGLTGAGGTMNTHERHMEIQKVVEEIMIREGIDPLALPHDMDRYIQEVMQRTGCTKESARTAIYAWIRRNYISYKERKGL